MKQHPNHEQWNKITKEKQFEILKKMNILPAIPLENYRIEKGYHFVSIGLMIEYIGEDWLQYLTKYCKDCKVSEYPDLKDLCDTLWDITLNKHL